MVEYLIKISGVHYGANGDSVALQKDTEESHVRTRELLSQIDRERPLVTLAPDPVNHIHQDKAAGTGEGGGRQESWLRDGDGECRRAGRGEACRSDRDRVEAVDERSAAVATQRNAAD